MVGIFCTFRDSVLLFLILQETSSTVVQTCVSQSNWFMQLTVVSSGFQLLLFNSLLFSFKFKNEFISETFKVRTQCFSEKIWFFRFWYSYSFWKDLSMENLVVSRLLLEVPKYKENVQICVITVIKVHNLLLTLLQVKTIMK